MPIFWDASTNGRAGAYLNVATPIYDGVDQGSPSILEDLVQSTCSLTGRPFDGNGDEAVDFSDLAHFVLCLNGPNMPVDPNCAD